MKLYIFTESYPHGQAETFFENEIHFLAEGFDTVIIIPLYSIGKKRTVPNNVEVWKPILTFNLKQRINLLTNGIFNFSPFIGVKEFFQKKVYQRKKWIWNYFTSLLLFRTLFAQKKLWNKLVKTTTSEDILYFYWGDKTTLILPSLKKKINNKAVVRFHGGDLYEERKSGYIPFRIFVFKSIDYFIPISNDGKKYLSNNYRSIVNDRKVYVSRLGVPDRGINPPKNKDNSIFHLLSCSYMVPVKRIDLIIDSLKYLDFPVKWTHIGGGILFNEIDERSKLLPKHIVVDLKGSISNDSVITFYLKNHIDLFINVSESEGVPVSIMEALSFGVPILATDVGGTAEIVDDKVGKLLQVEISTKKLAEEISYFANSDASDLRKQARIRWAEHSDANRNYHDFVKLLIK